MTIADYQDLLARKRCSFSAAGLIDIPDLNAAMFPHQRITTEFLLRAGCGGAFLDTGLGKSLIALEWGRCVAAHTRMPVLMLAPLAVGPQHQAEAEKFGVDAIYMRERRPGALPPIVITNYERLHLWDVSEFAGVILDESSILKSFTGAIRNQLIELFRTTPWRLAATATPAPNDHMELGNHAEFLGVMQSREMLSRFFVNDTSSASQKWRLKGHAQSSFWDWMASWSRCISLPSDIGCDDTGYALPDIVEKKHIVDVDRSLNAGSDGDQARMFRMPELSATSLHREKALTLDARADAIAEAVMAEPSEAWSIWVDTNDEADAICARIKDAIEVRGSMPADEKEARLVAFSRGSERVIVTKTRIAGFGLNWQHCARTAFPGITFSWEQYYQAVRRHHRFGQTRPVHVHRAMGETERSIYDAVMRKEGDNAIMKAEMRAAMRRTSVSVERQRPYDAPHVMEVPSWLN